MKLKRNFAGVLLLLSSFTFPVQAQPVSEPSEQVTVFAPYVVQKSVGGLVRSRGQLSWLGSQLRGRYCDVERAREAGCA